MVLSGLEQRGVGKKFPRAVGVSATSKARSVIGAEPLEESGAKRKDDVRVHAGQPCDSLVSLDEK